MSPKGRHAKSKARINSYEDSSGAGEREAREETWRSTSRPDPGWGKWSSRRSGVSKAYGDRLLIEGMSFSLPPGGIVGIIGPNGAGKTTLFRMITGQEKPDSGTIRIGETVKLAYVDQSRDVLDPDKTIWEMISDGEDIDLSSATGEVNSRAYVARFNFSGTDQQKKVGLLSGGERNRVHLARMLKEGANVLLLDEPTNDLDVNTMRALEEALENFAGCAVSSATTAGSSTGSPPTSWPSRGTARSSGSTGTIPSTRRTERPAWAPRPTSPTGSSTGS